jgi:SpoVK/Ycf46/Vps4 family AAA+-type ATPase
LDEIDSICNSSNTDEILRRAKTELLCQLDHFFPQDSKIIIVIAATNKPDKIDAAIRKRFEKRIYVPFPSKADRLHMIENNLKTIDHELEEKDL